MRKPLCVFLGKYVGLFVSGPAGLEELPPSVPHPTPFNPAKMLPGACLSTSSCPHPLRSTDPRRQGVAFWASLRERGSCASEWCAPPRRKHLTDTPNMPQPPPSPIPAHQALIFPSVLRWRWVDTKIPLNPSNTTRYNYCKSIPACASAKPPPPRPPLSNASSRRFSRLRGYILCGVVCV